MRTAESSLDSTSMSKVIFRSWVRVCLLWMILYSANTLRFLSYPGRFKPSIGGTMNGFLNTGSDVWDNGGSYYICCEYEVVNWPSSCSKDSRLEYCEKDSLSKFFWGWDNQVLIWKFPIFLQECRLGENTITKGGQTGEDRRSLYKPARKTSPKSYKMPDKHCGNQYEMIFFFFEFHEQFD